MAVSLGSHVFGCGDYHTALPITAAPEAEIRIEVAGLDGVGKIMLGKRTRPIPIVCTYAGYATEAALVAQLLADEAVKAGEPETLSVDGFTASNCQLLSLEVMRDPFGRYRFLDGKTGGKWVALQVVLFFEQLNA